MEEIGVTLSLLAAVVVSSAFARETRLALPLDNAVDDAKSVGDTLETLGFEVTLETNRDLRRLRRALDDFREDGAGADVAQDRLRLVVRQ